MACNNDIALTPLEKSAGDSIANYNFKALPDNDYYRANPQGIYQVDIELYLRPFQDLAPQTPILLNFQTEKFGVFIINKDTLYPEDQTKLLLSDFKNLRKTGQFYTKDIGKQGLTFEIEISKTRKLARANFETK